MLKKLLLSLALLASTNALSYERDIKLGSIKNIKIMVSCPSNLNQGEINNRSIIENFYVIGENEKKRNKVSGCQFLQSYPLFVENGELRMWVKYIDGSLNDDSRIAQMREHGSVLLGKLDSNQLSSCEGPNAPWFNFVDVVPNPNLKVTEYIRKKNKRYHHSMRFDDRRKRVRTVGWITQKKRASRAAERYCYYKSE